MMRMPSISIEMASPEEVQVLLEAAQVYYARGEYLKAEKIFRGALVLSPGSAEILSAIGSALQAQDKDEEALEYYEAALGDCPHDLASKMNRAELWLRAGQTDKAIAELESVLDMIHPDNIVAERANLLLEAAKQIEEEAKKKEEETESTE